MEVQEPEGATTYSASRNKSRTRAATSHASCRKPVLNAGWPQQVCAGLNVTSTPRRRRTFTAHAPTWGKNWSPIQVMKNATRSFCETILIQERVVLKELPAACGYLRLVRGVLKQFCHPENASAPQDRTREPPRPLPREGADRRPCIPAG